MCTPGAGPSPDCVASCEKTHEPGAYYDDDGEYQTHDDLRTDGERAADHDACASECASVPSVSPASIDACVAACTADGGGEAPCSTDCDPDPYDACRYAPCD